jgi:hypothetical protein
VAGSTPLQTGLPAVLFCVEMQHLPGVSKQPGQYHWVACTYYAAVWACLNMAVLCWRTNLQGGAEDSVLSCTARLQEPCLSAPLLP